MEITVLCKVVDNFGDIGVAFRLVKQLKKVEENLCVNLIVDDLVSFNKICALVDVSKNYQNVLGIDVYNWNDSELCYKTFKNNDGERLKIILELFQCGRPEWMEKILFEDKLERTVQIIMIDYLTAEKYAEDFHCLDSLTRSKKVKKINFMPGYTEKTGGLIIDDLWSESSAYQKNGPVLLFTYERNWKPFLSAWNEYRKNNHNDCKILVAQGKGCKSTLDTLENEAKLSPDDFEELPFTNQEEWDLILKKCSFLFIRGEESMSRACLSGIPFIWHAYPQSDEYQLVKVNALLERMEEYFEKEDFETIRKIWLIVNSPDDSLRFQEECQLFEKLFMNLERVQKGFDKFACALRKNGDLGANLMTFIKQLDII